MLGFDDSVGIDDENRQDSRDYPDDFYEGQTDSFTAARTPFTTRIRITGPADFTLNSVGTKTEDSVKDGRRTVVWESEHPVSFFNVVAGRWAVERGEGTAVFYHPGHPYNIDEMRQSLDAARRYYSEWFFPFPWRELKLSEFPNLASYAQGFPTNITFSEGIGFLAQEHDRRSMRPSRSPRTRPRTSGGATSSCRARAREASSWRKGRRTSPRSCWSSRSTA